MIIGLCGAQGSGKDTVANILVSKHGFIRISFASALKDVISILFSWPREMLEGDAAKSRAWREAPDAEWSLKTGIADFSPQKALQYVGTDLIRNQVYADIWVDIVKNRIRSNPDAKIVVSDCRFINEAQMLKTFPNMSIVRVLRKDASADSDKGASADSDKGAAAGDLEKNVHMNETSDLDPYVSITLDNDSTIEALESTVGWLFGVNSASSACHNPSK
jgi:hypothetical protein